MPTGLLRGGHPIPETEGTQTVGGEPPQKPPAAPLAKPLKSRFLDLTPSERSGYPLCPAQLPIAGQHRVGRLPMRGAIGAEPWRGP